MYLVTYVCYSARSNAEQSSLLKLPVELRLRIYELLLTGNSIHILMRYTSLTTVELHHVICQFPDLETDLYAPSAQAPEAKDPPTAVTEEYEDLHSSCHEKSNRLTLALRAVREPNRAADLRIRAEDDQLSLHFLATCRQIWFEAHKLARGLVYSGNTFSFHIVSHLDLFLRALQPEQRQLIRSIALHIPGTVRERHFETIADLVNQGYMPSLTNFSLVIVDDVVLPQLSRNPFGLFPPKNVQILFARDSAGQRPDAERLERFLMRTEGHT